MWKALAGFLFKAFASIGAIFMARKAGATKQRLEDAEESLARTQEGYKVDKHVDGLDEAELDQELKKYMRKGK